MNINERQHLSSSLDLPPQLGGEGLHSLVRAADEELLGSWASVTTDLIAFFRSKGLQVYDKLANALDTMCDEESNLETPVIPALTALLLVITRAHVCLTDISTTEMEFATSTIMGERVVEIPGRYAPREAATRPEQMVLPDLRVPGDYATTSCKHECAVLKQSSHIRHAHAVWT